jgi:magnesium-transporting ATPase (P-type)
MTQAGIVVSQFFNSFAARSDRESLMKVGLFSNPPLIMAGLFALGFMSCVSYLAPLQRIFNTAPLTLADWLILVGFGVLLLAADETRKAAWRHLDRRRQDALASGPPQKEG